MTKTQHFKFDTISLLFSGKGAFSHNLFCRNEPNFNCSISTATSYNKRVYNASHPKPKNGTNPNEPNFFTTSKPHFSAKLFSEIPWITKKPFYGKQTQFQKPGKHCKYLQKRDLHQFTPTNQQQKQTQSKPNPNPISDAKPIIYSLLSTVLLSRANGPPPNPNPIHLSRRNAAKTDANF